MTRKQELQPHRYSGVVEYQRDNGDIGAVILGCTSQDETMRELRHAAHYYAGLGYEVKKVLLDGVCPACDGAGGLRNKRSKMWHACKSCDARGELWELEMEPAAVLALPDPGSRHSL